MCLLRTRACGSYRNSIASSALAAVTTNPKHRSGIAALALLASMLISQTSSTLHQVVVQHVACAEHGVIEHAEDGHAEGPHLGDPHAEGHDLVADVHDLTSDQHAVRGADGADAHGHEACEHLAHRRDEDTLEPARVARIGPIEAPALTSALESSSTFRAIDLLALAPKASPPA